MKIIVAILVLFYSLNSSLSIAQNTKLISKYQKQLTKATGQEKKFLIRLIETIKKFETKKLDTVIYQIAHFEANNQADTVTSHIYEKKDSIYVTCEWRKNSVLYLTNTIKNPYIYIDSSEIYQYDKRSIWVIFTIGIYYAIPEIENIKNYMDLFMCVENGVESLKSIGITVKIEDYKNYILNYKGDLITYGEPEVRDGMFIWYEPSKRFLLYYHE